MPDRGSAARVVLAPCRAELAPAELSPHAVRLLRQILQLTASEGRGVASAAILLQATRVDSGTYRLRDVWTLPGWLSLSRIGFAIAFPFSVDRGAWAVAILAGAALSDFLDGYFARRLHQTSATGAALDPITDKIFASTVMLTLLATDRLSILQALLLSVRELLELPLALFLATASHARVARSARLGANVLGKVTTALQFVALVAVLFELPTTDVWIAATALLGALAATAYWQRFLAALRAPATTGGAHELGR